MNTTTHKTAARIAWEESVHKISEAIHAHGIRSEKAEKAEKDSNDLYAAYQQEREVMNTREQYHPMKVWTWSKEDQAAYQDKIQPLLDAAAEEEEMYTPDQLEAIADLDRMKAYQEKYPEAYQTAYRELLNSPIDKAQRTYANGYNRLVGTINTALRAIWQRETPPEGMDADQWRTLAAIDRLHEYELMATLA